MNIIATIGWIQKQKFSKCEKISQILSILSTIQHNLTQIPYPITSKPQCSKRHNISIISISKHTTKAHHFRSKIPESIHCIWAHFPGLLLNGTYSRLMLLHLYWQDSTSVKSYKLFKNPITLQVIHFFFQFWVWFEYAAVYVLSLTEIAVRRSLKLSWKKSLALILSNNLSS